MRKEQGNKLAALENVRTFLSVHAAEIHGVVTPTTEQLIVEAIDELLGHASTQDACTRAAAGVANRQRVTRLALIRDHMAPVATIARLELKAVPELVAFRLPGKRVSLQQLAAAAEGMADAAAPYASVFIAAGCKPDFVAQLKNQAAEMRTASYERTQNRARVKEATTELRKKHTRARKVIHILDAFMKSALADRPGLLEAWNITKRVATPRNGASAAAVAPDSTESPVTTPLAAAA